MREIHIESLLLNRAVADGTHGIELDAQNAKYNDEIIYAAGR